jgi:hypothetical protein
MPAGIIDQTVELAMFGNGGADQVFYFIFVCDITLNEDGTAWPTLVEFYGECFTGHNIARAKDYVRASLDKRLHATFSDSFAAPSDENDFVCVVHGVFLLEAPLRQQLLGWNLSNSLRILVKHSQVIQTHQILLQLLQGWRTCGF